MNPQPGGMASQEPQTASNKSESKSKYAFTQNAVLRTLDRKILDEGLRKQWRFFSEDDTMFGSLDIRGGYVAHDPAWIPGAKEEQAFGEAYENMVKIIQGICAEDADNFSAYMEHRLRLATSTNGGKTLGPLLDEVLSNEVSNPEMRIAAVSPPSFSLVQMTKTEIKELKFQAAQALHPERYAKLDANDDTDINYSRNEERKNSKEVTAKSLDGRSFALLVNNSLGKRKRLSGDEDDDDMEIVKNSNDGNVITATADTSTVHSKPLEDETFKSQSVSKEYIAPRAMRADTHLTNKFPPLQTKKNIYSRVTPEKNRLK
ncbi:hypothetical protein BPAE_0021g00460 [Botrytis paeoniae]|uniref:Uncharacterized protein n=1 Tax=Botrytis paeoniae TaxID=278948 RepID=A0A4Z1G4N9_9HELO|nr:hypothetical protein BPAE_0021g00460 [Botrytis paeoniae]